MKKRDIKQYEAGRDLTVRRRRRLNRMKMKDIEHYDVGGA